MDDIKIIIRGEEFTASKTILSEFSDYFRAMFSGSYVENEQTEIVIDVLDPKMMSIILQYMQIGLIDLSEYSLDTLKEMAIAANFLQATELIKQIDYTLETRIDCNNFMEIMNIAETVVLSNVRQLAASHGLISFDEVKPECIPSMQKLFWYLSHTHLNALSEYDVFKFGQKWILLNQARADSFMVLLCCLDYENLNYDDLKKIHLLLNNSINSVAENVIDCLCYLTREGKKLTASSLTAYKSRICENFSERVYTEIFNLVRDSIKRVSLRTPAVPMWFMVDNKPSVVPHNLYIYNKDSEFKKWLEVADQNLWGWSVASWGLTKVVVVGGEHGRGTGIFMKDVRVYHTLKKEWTHHGVELPPRRHAGIAVVGDLLFIVGGIGAYRVMLDTALVYDLKQRTYRKIANFQDAVQNPAVCAHKNEIYACGHRDIYKYEENESTERWTLVAHTDMRACIMVSFKEYIYCSQNYYNQICRFKPGIDYKVEDVTNCNCNPAAMCNMGNCIWAFTRTACGHSDIVRVEELNENHNKVHTPMVKWLRACPELYLNDVAGSCVVVTDVLPINNVVYKSHKRYLQMFSDT